MKSEVERLEIDLPTLVGIASIAWILVNMLHEIVGHAGMAALLGIPVKAVYTTAAIIEWDQGSSIGVYRAINAAGPLINLIGAIIGLILLNLLRQANSATRYFLWLFSVFNMVIVVMNLVSLGLMGAGDWVGFTRELEPASLWKAIFLGGGVIIAFFGYVLPLRMWMPDLRAKRWHQLLVTGIPVATLIVLQSLSLVGSPLLRSPSAADHWLACVFAYLHFVFWVILVNLIPVPRSQNPTQSIRLPRSYGWIALGMVCALIYLLVLGPGIVFQPGDMIVHLGEGVTALLLSWF